MAVVPFIGAASTAGTERGTDLAMADAMKRCEAALAAHRDPETTPAACAVAVGWKLYVPKSKRIRPILVMRQSLVA